MSLYFQSDEKQVNCYKENNFMLSPPLVTYTRRAISKHSIMSKKRTIDAFFAPPAKHRKVDESEDTEKEAKSV